MSDVEFTHTVRSLQPLIARLERRRDTLIATVAEQPDALEARAELGRVDVALRWAMAGHYGTCTVCSDRLPRGQLDANPADTVCRSCAEAASRSRRRRAPEVDKRPLSLIDGPDALTRGFAHGRTVTRE